MSVPAKDLVRCAAGELCGCLVDAALSDSCYLGIGPGGRGVALKRMEEDCLLRGLLHPSIRERLLRVRELAHGGVANLFGVGQDGNAAWLIWEYVQGEPFVEHARKLCGSPRDLALLCRELVLAVQSLHRQGIVHGAIKSGNVIVSPGGAVRLTQISPLLFNDPAADAIALVDLLRETSDACGVNGAALRDWLAQQGDALPLDALSSGLASLADPRPSAPVPVRKADSERHVRRRAVLAAAVMILAGAAGAFAVWQTVGDPPAHLRLKIFHREPQAGSEALLRTL